MKIKDCSKDWTINFNNMQHFRLPRKLKKKLNKKLWLYPENKDGHKMAWPSKYEEDYQAYKTGIVKDILNRKPKREPKPHLDEPIEISDDELKLMVNDIIRKDLRISSHQKLIEAKKHPATIRAYHNFINAYNHYKSGNDSYGNICCLSIDYANDLLKKKKKISK
ncbi:MAG: hypothetical protein ACNS60_13410 [Candidatus Cyclobacteriaceae bacterium M2_1C_046]